MGLKDRIEKLKAERARERAEEDKNASAAQAARRRELVAQAKSIVADIPAKVAEALSRDRKSIFLYHGAEVTAPVESNTGVVAEIVKLLEKEGLVDQLWIDIDCSGYWYTQNALHMNI